MSYYMVTCHRGHCGTGHSTEIKFAIEAKNILDACAYAKKMPSVKHTRPVLNAKEITQAEYIEYKKISAYERNPMERGKYARKRKRG